MSYKRCGFFFVCVLLGAIFLFPWSRLQPGAAAGIPPAEAAASTLAPVYVANLTGQIAPVSASYCDRVIQSAERNRADALIITLDTPGGSYDTTQDIVTAISNSTVPVVVFVSPAGGWAGSAGTFITMSANVAAMAPGSRIGAAHPVIEGAPLSQAPADNSQNIPFQKLTQDAAAWIRSLAQAHGRNPVAAEQAVLESKSFSDTEALQVNLIDLRAKDLPDLLNQLQGRTVTLSSGVQVQLQTLNAPLVYVPMSSLENFLLIISDPNLAYLLLILGMAGLLVEVYHPGLILPGVVGGISMLIGLYSLGTLDAYWGGILLIILAFCFFVAEAFTFSHGALGVGGLISLVTGSLLLFSNQPYGQRVSGWLIAGTVLVFALLLALLITLVVRGQQQPVRTGREGMIGQKAVARSELHPEGTVFVSGELWKAVSISGTIPYGAEVVITGVDGLKLKVRAVQH